MLDHQETKISETEANSDELNSKGLLFLLHANYYFLITGLQT